MVIKAVDKLIKENLYKKSAKNDTSHKHDKKKSMLGEDNPEVFVVGLSGLKESDNDGLSDPEV